MYKKKTIKLKRRTTKKIKIPIKVELRYLNDYEGKISSYIFEEKLNRNLVASIQINASLGTN